MKKILLLLLCFSFSVGSAKALTLNEDGSFTNELGIQITKEQYEILSEKNSDSFIDHFDQKLINVLTSKNAVITSDKVYSVSTYNYDQNGNIISENTIETTKEKAMEVTFNNNYGMFQSNSLTVSPMGNYQNTDSKEVGIEYYKDSEGYVIHLSTNWFKLPKIRLVHCD